ELITAFVVTTGHCEPAKEKLDKDSPANSLEARRAKCMKLDAKALGIIEPVEVKEAWHLKDGGSLTLLLLDKNKTEHEFIIRRSASGPMDIVKGPKLTEPKRVEFGGPEEQELYGVLLRWADKHPKKADLLKKKGGDLTDETLHGVQGMLIRLDNRITIYLGGVVPE
ncbi:MAG: hypothetical protein L0Y70_25685, partial [Gemmataceae bacterium]|nr:hypothetical protein [Gemmataceae bacterium]